MRLQDEIKKRETESNKKKKMSKRKKKGKMKKYLSFSERVILSVIIVFFFVSVLNCAGFWHTTWVRDIPRIIVVQWEEEAGNKIDLVR